MSNNNKRRCATFLAVALLSASGMSMADRQDNRDNERKGYHESIRHANASDSPNHEQVTREQASHHSRHFAEDRLDAVEKNQRPHFKHAEKRKLERHDGDQFKAGVHRHTRSAVLAREEREVFKKYLAKLPEEERKAMRKELKELRKEIKRSGYTQQRDRRHHGEKRSD